MDKIRDEMKNYYEDHIRDLSNEVKALQYENEDLKDKLRQIGNET